MGKINCLCGRKRTSKINRLFSIILSLFSCIMINANAQDSNELLSKMFKKTAQIQTLKYYLIIHQRIKGIMHIQKAYIKIQRNPLKIYYRQDVGYKAELLFIEGQNNNKALVNLRTLPFFNLNLDPYGSLMRKNQHHTIFDADFNYGVGIVEILFNKYKSNNSILINQDGTVLWDGNECYKLILQNLNFAYVDYKVNQGENITSLAAKLKLNDYMILELNNLSKYYSVKTGQLIKIPNDYAYSMELYLDKQRYIPLYMKIYDDKGLYEQFEFTNVEIDPKFAPDEFSKTFKEYKF